MTIAQDLLSLTPGNLITFYSLDLSGCYRKDGTQTQEFYRWCDGVNELGNDIVWQTNTYTRMPIQATGFDKLGDGSMPRPKLTVANIQGTVGALTREYGDLCGAKLTRQRTFVKYIDTINFAQGNEFADPTQYLDKEIWIVDRKANENSVFIEWELSTPFDLNNVKIPRRQTMQNCCTWRYRVYKNGSFDYTNAGECGYTGTNYFDIYDNPTTQDKDQCGKRLSSCKKRFGEQAILPFGGFPSVGLF